MCRTKFVLVFLCLVHLVQPRKLYYPNPHDPSAIVFEGPTNYETRKASENEIETDIVDPTFVRFGEIGVPEIAPKKAPKQFDSGFYFPED
ncbi:hypothetical protein B5X24_HaOG205745 [Helicoverpa armigera]|uniref:Uncharacterized protein n=1 Tax=Helicoverpa armigera TaxID=29058 RepID=A0A2W1BQ34_HELAM|nr:hypothetical protein B5X24_HaOG205745 [Helicoverpa armigera]